MPNVQVVSSAEAKPMPGIVVRVSKQPSVLTVTDASGKVVMHAPVTSGSEHDPLPIGSWTVTAVARNPNFNYNPDLFWDADPKHAKATLPPGPNGPVGVVWIEISKPHYGIHGTPEPATVGHTSLPRLRTPDQLGRAAARGDGGQRHQGGVRGVRRQAGPRPSWLMYAAGAGFLAGVAVTAAIRPVSPQPRPVAATIEVKPGSAETPPPVAPPAPPVSTAPPVISADPIEDLRRRQLTLPVQSIAADDIRDSFNELRGGSRRHEAIDVLAPRHTPVLAVEDGTVARLFLSEAGGITLYQFDPTATLRLLLRPSRGLRAGAQGEGPRQPRAGGRLRGHHRQRAPRHAAPPLRDLQDGR